MISNYFHLFFGFSHEPIDRVTVKIKSSYLEVLIFSGKSIGPDSSSWVSPAFMCDCLFAM